QTIYLDVLEGETLACAPSFIVPVFYLVDELGEDNHPPAAFDHLAYHQFCFLSWNAAQNAATPACYAQVGEVRPAGADVLAGRAEFIRRIGESGMPYFDRWLMASSVSVEGHLFEATPLPANSVAPISEPDQSKRGWGLNPQYARPDAVDPTDP